MKRNIVTAAMLLVMLAAPFIPLHSQQGRGMGPCGKGLSPCCQNRLMVPDLSEEQQEQMKKIRLEHLKTINPLKEELNSYRMEYRKLMASRETDMKAVDQNIDKQTEVQNKILKGQAKLRKDLENLLTEEQRLLMGPDSRSGIRGFSMERPCAPGFGRGYGPGMHRGYGRGYGWRGSW